MIERVYWSKYLVITTCTIFIQCGILENSLLLLRLCLTYAFGQSLSFNESSNLQTYLLLSSFYAGIHTKEKDTYLQ